MHFSDSYSTVCFWVYFSAQEQPTNVCCYQSITITKKRQKCALTFTLWYLVFISNLHYSVVKKRTKPCPEPWHMACSYFSDSVIKYPAEFSAFIMCQRQGIIFSFLYYTTFHPNIPLNDICTSTVLFLRLTIKKSKCAIRIQYTNYNARSTALELNHFYGRFVYVHFFTFIQ